MLQIIPVTGTELHVRYPRETAPQKVHVRLDARDGGRLWADADAPGGGAPRAEWDGHVQTWPIPALCAAGADHDAELERSYRIACSLFCMASLVCVRRAVRRRRLGGFGRRPLPKPLIGIDAAGGSAGRGRIDPEPPS